MGQVILWQPITHVLGQEQILLRKVGPVNFCHAQNCHILPVSFNANQGLKIEYSDTLLAGVSHDLRTKVWEVLREQGLNGSFLYTPRFRRCSAQHEDWWPGCADPRPYPQSAYAPAGAPCDSLCRSAGNSALLPAPPGAGENRPHKPP